MSRDIFGIDSEHNSLLREDCTIYHDASTGKPFAHGLLVIPSRSSSRLAEALLESRQRWNCKSKRHFADIGGGKFTKKDRCIEEWIALGVEALRHKRQDRTIFPEAPCCKLLVIFLETLGQMDRELYGGAPKKEKELRKIETLLRIGLKGGLHYCYSDECGVRLEGFITDGMPWHRSLDDRRVLDRLRGEARGYVEIPDRIYIESIVSDHNDPKCQDPVAANLLQLCDLLLGSTIQACARDARVGSKKEIVSRRVRDMLDKTKRGSAFRNSGHYKSFAISVATVEGSAWTFQRMTTRERVSEFIQQRLFRE